MMIYHKFAEAYSWPPSVVDKLTLDQLYWLPVVREATSDALEQVQAARQAARSGE
jgi:hypothetical protein